MPLSLLLDEQMSPTVARQIAAKRPDIPIVRLYDWYGGAFVGAPDEALLRVAASDAVTLVTYDRKSITPILMAWGQGGEHHAGIAFADGESIPQADIGGLTLALISLWDETHDWDWSNVVATLTPL